MKNIALALAFAFFLVLAGLSSLVVVDPVGMANLVGLAPQTQSPVSTRQIQATTAETEQQRQPVDRRQAGRADGEEQQAEPRAPARRPPTRGETVREDEQPRVQLARMGRHVGPRDQAPAGRPPRPELYPFEIVDRSFPSPGTMTVTLAVKNASGAHWRTAYVTLRSTGPLPAQLFEIQDWGIDEVVGLDYTFPRGEVGERLRELRIIDVSGEQRESALADLLARSRQRYVEAITPTDDARLVASASGSLNAPGLLGMLGAMQSPMTGVRVTMLEPRLSPHRPVHIEIPSIYRIPATSPIEITGGGSAEARRAVDMAEQFLQQAADVESALNAFTAELAKGPFEEVIAQQAGAALAELRQTLQAFNATGVELAALAQASRDSEVRRMNLGPALTEYSRRIVNQLTFVEQELQGVSPGFRIQQSR